MIQPQPPGPENPTGPGGKSTGKRPAAGRRLELSGHRPDGRASKFPEAGAASTGSLRAVSDKTAREFTQQPWLPS
jgi:hypothetical protein